MVSAVPSTSVDTLRPRILVVRVGAMGDVLHGLPAVTALRNALPHAFLGWAIEPRWASLLQAGQEATPRSSAMPLVDRVHRVETRLWSKRPVSAATFHSILQLRRSLRSEHYDLAIDLQGSVRSAVIARLSGAKLIAGNASPRETLAKHLYRPRVEAPAQHVVDQAAQIATAALRTLVPGAAALSSRQPLLPRDADAERWCDALLERAARPVVLLAPTAGWGAKEWPAERYGQLASRLEAGGFRVLVNAAGEHDRTAQKVLSAAANSGTCSVQAVASTLPQLTALVRRVALVIAGDTGPLHLAAALGVPVVALFGPTDPERNGPWGTPAVVLRDSASVTDHRRHAVTEAGLMRIPVDAVFAAAMELAAA